jgi:hypothetical protein
MSLDLLKRATTIPAPLVVDPSQSFEGADGSWSTFTIAMYDFFLDMYSYSIANLMVQWDTSPVFPRPRLDQKLRILGPSAGRVYIG